MTIQLCTSLIKLTYNFLFIMVCHCLYPHPYAYIYDTKLTYDFIEMSLSISTHIFDIRIDKKIRALEIEHNIPQRWTCDSTEYKRMKNDLAVKKKNAVLADLSSCTRDHWFMLSVKGKFAGQ